MFFRYHMPYAFDVEIRQEETTVIYSPVQLSKLNRKTIPRHVAIIPDGNRRWARQNLSRVEEGHKEGGNVLLDIVKAAKEIGIEAITVYGFSTENWSRSSIEIRSIMGVINRLLKDQCAEMVASGVRLETIGDLTKLPQYLNDTIAQTKLATAHCDKIDLVLALNYGGRDEIRRAVMAMNQDCLSNKLPIDQITEKTIEGYLDTAQWPDPELLIRTSGEMRISNFLLWQMSYAEVYVANVLWPDFTPQHLLEAVINYQQRERRLGGV
jgi:undecaprenyl diphosphate synthase